MAILRTAIIRALEELIANEAGASFQALAIVLAKQKWPDLIASSAPAVVSTPSVPTADGCRASIAAPYWRLRASLSISVTVTLYFAITSLTKAVTWATSGFSGINALSISIMPFSIAM
jgi:hypothetical protein